MRLRDIEGPERGTFLRELSRLHAGAIVTMSVASPSVPVLDEVVAQPLRGISTDGSDVIVQIGANGSGPHFAHRIVGVDSLRLQQTDEGADAGIDIAGADDARTIVRFHSPVLPELLDPAVE